MSNNSQDLKNVASQANTISADDPDMIDKLNEIALKIAEAQGKNITPKKNHNINIANDPMDELGCEGCQ